MNRDTVIQRIAKQIKRAEDQGHQDAVEHLWQLAEFLDVDREIHRLRAQEFRAEVEREYK